MRKTEEGEKLSSHTTGGLLLLTWKLPPTWDGGFSRTERCRERGSSRTGVLQSMLFRVQGCLHADMALPETLLGRDGKPDGLLHKDRCSLCC